MFILRFTFENHRSFREETDLSMVDPGLRTSRPSSGTWANYTSRVAAIYGPNASGKSGVLDALRFMRHMIAQSATSSLGKRLPYVPFALDEESRNRPSTYVLDFVLDDVRYQYGFALTAKAVLDEWMYTYPTGRKRVLFERGSEEGDLTFGRALVGGGESTLAKATGARELVLSKAASLRNLYLGRIWASLLSGITVAQFGEADRHERLRSVIKEVAEGTFDMDDLRIMLKVADIGIADADVAESETDPKFKRMLRAILNASRDEDDDSDVEEYDDEKVEEMLTEFGRSLLFRHTGSGDETYPLSSELQSTGTLTWLSLAAPALKTIREGGVLAVDEIDASLHPQLAEVMIQMFRDESINTKCAQLIFTTHDTYFLSSTSQVRLRPNETWFVEKGRDGVSDMFQLSDFPVRDDQNFSRRYLQGRYGAIPSVAPSFLAAISQSPAMNELKSSPADADLDDEHVGGFI